MEKIPAPGCPSDSGSGSTSRGDVRIRNQCVRANLVIGDGDGESDGDILRSWQEAAEFKGPRK